MKLFEYLDSKYVATNMELSVARDPVKQGVTKAAVGLLNTQLKWFTFVAYFKLLGSYTMMKVGVAPALPTAAELLETYRKVKTAQASFTNQAGSAVTTVEATVVNGCN